MKAKPVLGSRKPGLDHLLSKKLHKNIALTLDCKIYFEYIFIMGSHGTVP